MSLIFDYICNTSSYSLPPLIVSTFIWFSAIRTIIEIINIKITHCITGYHISARITYELYTFILVCFCYHIISFLNVQFILLMPLANNSCSVIYFSTSISIFLLKSLTSVISPSEYLTHNSEIKFISQSRR